MQQFFTVGPSQLHPQYELFWQESYRNQVGSISHRSQQFRDIYRFTEEQLRILLSLTPEHRVYFTPSATEIWERMLLNVVENTSFHLVNGAFSKRFYEFSGLLGKQNLCYEVPQGQGFDDVAQIEIPSSVELICTTQNETSSGIQIPTEDLILLKDRHPQSLICTDIVSSAPYAAVNFEKMDMAFFSVQKAFGLPPGLGVWIVNDASLKKAAHLKQKGILQGAHHTLESFEKNHLNWETPSTPNVMAIDVLGKMAAYMNRMGIDLIRKDTEVKFEMLKHFEASHPGVRYTTNHVAHLSRTVCVWTCEKNPKDILEKMKARQYLLAGGYGVGKAEQIRIANFPSSTVQDMEKMLQCLSEVIS
ncbi:MAG: aminotransferase class V-fold PLP-dependent enzyme [Chitinophagaceae bacterium]